MNTTSVLPIPVQQTYDRTTIERALPFLTHDKFGQVRDIPKGQGDTVKFRKYGSLDAATTPLTEGVTPPGKLLSATDITAQVKQYGDYVVVTDWLTMTSEDPVLVEAAEVLGEQAGLTLDTLLATVLAAGTSVFYAGSQNARANVGAAHKVSTTDLLKIVRNLSRANARPVTSMVDPSTGYNTTPLSPSYVGLIHPNTTYDLKQLTGWEDVSKYANNPGSRIMPGEVGRFDRIRFVESTQATVFEGAGASGIDVYATLIFGANAYGVTRISGEAMKNIVKPLGSAGTADPLNQRATSGWKATFAAAILQQLFMERYEHAVSA